MIRKLKKYVEQLLGTGYQLIVICIENLLTDPTYNVCTSARLKNF